MKKFLIVITVIGLFTSLNAQNLTRGMWQLQNPNPMNVSSILTFKNGQVKNCMMDMFTNTVREAVGTYSISGSTLTILMN